MIMNLMHYCIMIDALTYVDRSDGAVLMLFGVVEGQLIVRCIILIKIILLFIYNRLKMSIDRRLWSPEVSHKSSRRTSKSSDWSTSTALRNGHSYLKNCVGRQSTKEQASSADRGSFDVIQMVQSLEP